MTGEVTDISASFLNSKIIPEPDLVSKGLEMNKLSLRKLAYWSFNPDDPQISDLCSVMSKLEKEADNLL